jgi:hypothetical protein
MKRTAEDAADDPVAAEDPPFSHVHEKIRAAREQRLTILARYTESPTPLPSLEGIEELFTEMERHAEEFLSKYDKPLWLHFFHGQSFRQPRVVAFKCAWWTNVVKWHEQVLLERLEYVRRHGSYIQAQEFVNEKADAAFQYLTDAIEKGWNTRQPKLPGSWQEDRIHFMVTYVE